MDRLNNAALIDISDELEPRVSPNLPNVNSESIERGSMRAGLLSQSRDTIRPETRRGRERMDGLGLNARQSSPSD